MRKRKLLLMTMLVWFTSIAWSQTRTITGTVSDETGIPVPFASISIKGSGTGTSADAGGKFSIKVAESSILIVSAMGYTSVEVGTQEGSVNVVLTKDRETLIDEVVVTGYGNVRRTQFAGAVTTIAAKDLTENRPLGSFTHTMQGRVPGMLVNSGSGQPGSSASITIRGVKSIQGAGAQPLYVLDGIPISSGEFQALNPNDFETITVLKDANAAALYGARGGTGVIVITTKKGKAGTTTFTAKAQYGITRPPDFSRLNLMNTSEFLQYEERVGLQTGSSTTAFNVPGWAWSRKNPANANKSSAELAEFDRRLDSVRGINTDIGKVLFRNGISQTYELGANGGSENTTFFVTGNYFKQQGIDLNSALDRYSARFNLNHTHRRVSIQWNNLISYSKLEYAEGDWLGNSPRNSFQMIYRAKPYDTPYRSDGSLIFGGGGTNLSLKSLGNLLEGYQNSKSYLKLFKLSSGITVNYKIFDDLTLRNVFGIDMGSNLIERYINPGSYIGTLQTFLKGSAQETYSIGSQLINTTALLYKKEIDRHTFDAGVYFEGIRQYNKGMGFTLFNLNPVLLQTGQGAADLPTNGAATMPQRASSARTGYGIRSYFGTLAYSYDSRYSINANLRRDGTSRIFNDANKEVPTWSVGAIWTAKNESFFKEQSVFSDLVFRATYGVIPNIGSIPNSTYGTGSGLWTVPNYAGTQIPYYTTTSYVGSTIPGISPAAPGNPDFKIERVQKANIGLDLAFLQNRIRLSVDAYKEQTVDLFVRQPLSATTGFVNLDINAGKMMNKGLEFMLDVNVVREGDFKANLSFNHAINDNEITDLGLVEEYFLGTFVIRKGLPYGTHYTYDYLGADPATGKPIFRTSDGGTTNDRAAAGQFANFGTYLPKHVGGFGADLSFKGFSVQAMFSYQFDVVRSNNTRNWITRGTVGYASAVNQSRELLDNQWTKPGDQKWFNSSAYDRDFTSSDLEDAKFLRFRTLNVAYTLPASLINKFNGKYIKGAAIYANFHNLAVWSPWRGVDPEDNNNISLVEYPNPRMMVFGIDIKF